MPNPTTIDGLLVALLTSNSAVDDIVSGRIKPWSNTIPSVKPSLTYYRITSNRPKTNDGPTGQANIHYQLDAWADDLLAAQQLTEAIRLNFDGYAGTFQGWKIDSFFVTDEIDATGEPVAPGQANPIQRRTLDITFSVAEAVPQ